MRRLDRALLRCIRIYARSRGDSCTNKPNRIRLKPWLNNLKPLLYVHMDMRTPSVHIASHYSTESQRQYQSIRKSGSPGIQSSDRIIAISPCPSGHRGHCPLLSATRSSGRAAAGQRSRPVVPATVDSGLAPVRWCALPQYTVRSSTQNRMAQNTANVQNVFNFKSTCQFVRYVARPEAYLSYYDLKYDLGMSTVLCRRVETRVTH